MHGYAALIEVDVSRGEMASRHERISHALFTTIGLWISCAECTVWYLGIKVDDAIEIAETIDIDP